MAETEQRIKVVILDWNRTLVIGDGRPVVFYPEVKMVLTELKRRNLKMGIVSAGGTDPTQRWKDFEALDLRSRGVSEFMVVGPNESKDLKPMIDKFGVKPAECLVAGDRISKEIEKGNEVGAVTFRVKRPGDKFAEDIPETELQKPDYTESSLANLPALIDQLNQKG